MGFLFLREKINKKSCLFKKELYICITKIRDMSAIKIIYRVDNPQWTDTQFEDEPYRVFHITTEMLVSLIGLKDGEFIYEIEDIKVIR